VSTGLGFTVLPRHAVGAFKDHDKVKMHQLTHNVSETLYVGMHRQKITPNRVKTIITAASDCLKNL
jgi:DNA-binding transcriptional LysR family regulator